MININNNINEIVSTANSIKRMVDSNSSRLDLSDIAKQLEDIVDSLDYVQYDVVRKSKIINV